MRLRTGLQHARDLLYEAAGHVGRRETRRLRNQRGQVMLEYVITTLMAVLGLIGVATLMHAAIGRYLLEIYFIVSLPIP